MIILTASIYDDDGVRLLGKAKLEIFCGDAFCDSCGDCLSCYIGDPCGNEGGDHFFVIYACDLSDWFGR